MQLFYKSLVDAIRRIMAHPKLAEMVTYHNRCRRSAAGDVCDFQDGTVYQEDILGDPDFANEPRNLFGALITDGLQPFKDDKLYSMWPVVFTFYNFPPHVRYLLGLTILLCVVPGTRSSACKFDLQSILQITMDELQLMKHGMWMYDGHKKEKYLCKAKLVQVRCYAVAG